MDDDMTSTLVIHGPEICADKAKKIIGTEFRRWPLEYCDTSMSRQAGDEASAVLVEIRLKTLVPPVEQVRTLSGEHPVLTFTLEFGRPSCEYRARLAYSEGKISAWAAKAKKTSHASPGDQAPAVSDGGQESEVPQPEMLRRLAEHFLKAAYGGIYSSIFEGVGLKPKDRCEILDQFAVCAEIRGLLPSEEKANLDGLEIECKAHESRLAKRIAAYNAGNHALALCADPDVAGLLNGDDREALQKFQETVRKFPGLEMVGT